MTDASAAPELPRLGFLGTGWIGRHRMNAVLEAQAAHAVAVSDPDPEAREQAAADAGARAVQDLDALLASGLDGLVIATPSALHADQAIAALDAGVAVFCQKPLARTAAETERVLAAAARADRLLGVDLSYRYTAAGAALREGVLRGDIGHPYAVELVFHNAYGPDKPWFTDRRLAGGGCVIDLATHLIDLALWVLPSAELAVEHAVLRHGGRPLEPEDPSQVEDFALATLSSPGGETVRLASSWFQPAGRECVIECTVIGDGGALSMHNVGGSFYDFVLERRTGTRAECLLSPPDEWGGRALVAWARELASTTGFDAARATEHRRLARAIDAIYSAGREG